MPSNFNPLQLVNMMRRSGNPQAFMMNMLQQNTGNPLLTTLLSLAQKNDTQGIEQIARNVVQERGLDYDKEFKDFKQQLGL